jgi:hypothetical protein
VLKRPKNDEQGLSGKPRPSILERILVRKAKPSKFQRELKKGAQKTLRGVLKDVRDIYEGKDGDF